MFQEAAITSVRIGKWQRGRKESFQLNNFLKTSSILLLLPPLAVSERRAHLPWDEQVSWSRSRTNLGAVPGTALLSHESSSSSSLFASGPTRFGLLIDLKRGERALTNKDTWEETKITQTMGRRECQSQTERNQIQIYWQTEYSLGRAGVSRAKLLFDPDPGTDPTTSPEAQNGCSMRLTFGFYR